MSNLKYTWDQLVAAAKNACAITSTGTDFDTGNASIDLVNDAVAMFAGEHDWSWLRRPLILAFVAVALSSLVRASGVLTATRTAHGLVAGDFLRVTGSTSADGEYFVASVPTVDTFTLNQTGTDETLATAGSYITGFVPLPADFLGLVNVERNSQVRTVYPVSQNRIDRFRTSGGIYMVGPTGFFYAIRAVPQTSDTGVGVMRMELYPTPTEAETAAMIGEYRRQPPVRTSGNSVPDLGPSGQVYACLRALCRAMAISTEEERAGEDWRRYERMLAKCIEQDGNQESVLGMMEGGIDDSAGYAPDHLYPTNIYAAP